MPGVTSTGFSVKSLTDIKAEIDSALVAAIGSGFDTSLDTPQGQISAVIADANATLWELVQDVYASFDVRQAKGVRLDQLGELRRLTRLQSETDDAYRSRLLQQRSQTGTAVERLTSAVSAVTDVTNVQAYYNTGGASSERAQQPLTMSLIVEGGDDNEVAQTIAGNLVFGLGLLGNTAINVDDGGVCRTIRYIRPDVIDMTLDIVTNTDASIGSCGGSSVSAIKQLMLTAFEGEYSRPGVTITADYLRALLLASGTGVQSLRFNDDLQVLALSPGQLARLDADNINVVVNAS